MFYVFSQWNQECFSLPGQQNKNDNNNNTDNDIDDSIIINNDIKTTASHNHLSSMLTQAKKARQETEKKTSLHFHAASEKPVHQNNVSDNKSAPAQTKTRPEVTQYREALFQAAERNDSDAFRDKVMELERKGYSLNEPELTDPDNRANLLHYTLENGQVKVTTMDDDGGGGGGGGDGDDNNDDIDDDDCVVKRGDLCKICQTYIFCF